MTLGFGSMVWFFPIFRVGAEGSGDLLITLPAVFGVMFVGGLTYWLGGCKKAIADKPLKESDWQQLS
jgi:hypothetical protein